jgi:hypothetical protein
MGARQVIAACLAAWGLAGCATFGPRDVAEPSDITIKAAMHEVAEGLVELRKELDREKMKVGLLVDEVNVNFNVTANATDTRKLSIDLSNGAATTSVINAAFKASDELVATGARGNTVQIKLKNIYTATLAPGAAGAASGGAAKGGGPKRSRSQDALEFLQGCIKNPHAPGCITLYNQPGLKEFAK